MELKTKTMTGNELRTLVRSGEFCGQTAGQAPDFLQGNVIILPQQYASDFLQFCLNNPKPCPLIGISKSGDPGLPELGKDLDIRHDVPRYHIYRDGELCEEVTAIDDQWSDDLVTFVLGCSFTFEEALMRKGFAVRHIEQEQNVPMFKSNIDTIKSGIFSGPLVVTMRPFRSEEIPSVFDISADYPQAHGSPIYWGDPKGIGINDLGAPDYGEPVAVQEDEVPVFWACGVTPQAAIARARPRLCITHAPGHMLVTDISSSEIISPISGMRSLVGESGNQTSKGD